MTQSDTIAAVSTAPGEGGIGIVRVSGDRAEEILKKIFVPRTEFADRIMYYGHIIDPSSSETVDEVLAVFMKGPRSYTGEDVCEIQCHGGGIPLRRILGLVCGLGAVPAQPGEFTKRAFLNGRVDLAQAGAVIDLIRSKTEKGYHAAKEQVEGRLSKRIHAIREKLLNALAEIAVRIDYPEEFEEENFAKPYEYDLTALEKSEEQIKNLLQNAEAGRIVQDGVRAVIIGKPNTGKSSLFNALAREDSAIVTPTPGTTRDALEIWLDIGGAPVLLVDTAGMRESADEIEKLGIERAKEQHQKSDITIFLLDGSEALSDEDRAIARNINQDKKLILAIGKADLPQVFNEEDAACLLPFPYDSKDVAKVSLINDERSKYGEIESVIQIEKAIEKVVTSTAFSGSSLLVTKVRHKMLLENAASEIMEARKEIARGSAPEFAEVNIRAAWNLLGELTGETATTDVIDKVFEEFCVGK